MAGERAPVARAPAPASGRRRRAAHDLETEVSLSFDQAVHGTQVPLSVPTSKPCPTCNGSGARPGTSPKVCPVCNGRGVEAQSQGIFSISQPCSNCKGSGTVIEHPCPTCEGSGAQRSVRRLRVNVPAGVRDGSRIKLAGKGDPGVRGVPPGDLYVITRVSESPIFKRSGDNLEVEVPLTIPEAIRGAVIEVPTLSGSKRLRVAAGHQARHHAAPARRGSAATWRQGQRRPALPLRDRRAGEPLGRADEAVDRLSQVMNGDPRAKLFPEAQASRPRRLSTDGFRTNTAADPRSPRVSRSPPTRACS